MHFSSLILIIIFQFSCTYLHLFTPTSYCPFISTVFLLWSPFFLYFLYFFPFYTLRSLILITCSHYHPVLFYLRLCYSYFLLSFASRTDGGQQEAYWVRLTKAGGDGGYIKGGHGVRVSVECRGCRNHGDPCAGSRYCYPYFCHLSAGAPHTWLVSVWLEYVLCGWVCL